jgi:Flp pilus assembly protein TadG
MLDIVRRRAKGDDGAILIFLALSITMLLVVAALVLDGGSAYVQRRQGQNAADAAAMAGARALDRYRFPPTGTTADVTTISSQVGSVAAANGATAVVSCRLINFDQVGTASDLGACTSATAASNAEGVRVTLSSTRTTYFGGVTGRTTTTANTSATASIQQLSSIGAPFLICGNSAKGGYNLLNSDGTLNPSNAQNVGEFTIHGSQVPDCGAGSQFKGLMDNNDIELNVWSDIGAQGNQVGQYTDVTTDVTACPNGGPYTNCDMLLPIMLSGQGSGSNATAFVTAYAVFHVTEGSTGNTAHTAHYVGTVTQASGGQGAGVDLGGSNSGLIRLIKLVE